jgi:hypothetical protein
MKGFIVIFLLGGGTGLQAQLVNPNTTAKSFTAAEVEKIAIPNLSFTETSADVENYDKYFYFLREKTSFDEAYADIVECDGYSRNLTARAPSQPVPYPYAGTLSGALGGAIGSIIVDKISGSSARRAERRTNMRTCMFFKEYGRFGLPKDVWKAFNFEEGNGKLSDSERAPYLMQQAKAASGKKPQSQDLGE